jgi:large subunit ribosomal protein L4
MPVPKLVIRNSKGKEVGKITVSEKVAKARVNTKVLYVVVNNYLASKHRGTHKTKTRREVRGGGKKPWRQKGTGRARFGSTRNPLWRGGGVAFGPLVRNYRYSIPKKARSLALFEAVKSRIQSEDVVVFDKISLEKPRTKDMFLIINSLKLGRKCLMVMEKVEGNIRLASRNIPDFSVKNRKDINALDVLRYDRLAISEKSLTNLIGREAKDRVKD